jgi:hypothetical protein
MRKMATRERERQGQREGERGRGRERERQRSREIRGVVCESSRGRREGEAKADSETVQMRDSEKTKR